LNQVLDNQVVLFVDLLGFSEFTFRFDPALQGNVLALLTSIAALKSDFVSNTTRTETGASYDVRPSISSFSDNIVASYSLARIDGDEDIKPLVIINHLSQLVAGLSVAALSLGFLIRGGIALGKLYHSGGVVFGQALIEAVSLESRTAIYPRIVLSEPAAKFFIQDKPQRFGPWLSRDFDGLIYVDYYRDCVLRAVQPGSNYAKGTEQWFNKMTAVLGKNLEELTGSQRAKWFYAAQKIKERVENLSPDLLKAFGIDPAKLPKLD